MSFVIGCETSEGFIPYPKHPNANFLLPVALDFSKEATAELYPPQKLGMDLVYVLPGGTKAILKNEKLFTI